MDGMCVVALVRGCVGKFHGAAEFVALPARRNVHAHPGFEHLGDLLLELADFREHVLLLSGGDLGFEAKREHMDEHGNGPSLGVHGDSWVSASPLSTEREPIEGHKNSGVTALRARSNSFDSAFAG